MQSTKKSKHLYFLRVSENCQLLTEIYVISQEDDRNLKWFEDRHLQEVIILLRDPVKMKILTHTQEGKHRKKERDKAKNQSDEPEILTGQSVKIGFKFSDRLLNHHACLLPPAAETPVWRHSESSHSGGGFMFGRLFSLKLVVHVCEYHPATIGKATSQLMRSICATPPSRNMAISNYFLTRTDDDFVEPKRQESTKMKEIIQGLKRKQTEDREERDVRAGSMVEGGFLEPMDTDSDSAAPSQRSQQSALEKTSSPTKNLIARTDHASVPRSSPLKKHRRTARESPNSPQGSSTSDHKGLSKQESSIINRHSEHFVENEDCQIVKSELQNGSSGALHTIDQDTKLKSTQEFENRLSSTSNHSNSNVSAKNLPTFPSSIRSGSDNFNGSSASASDASNPLDIKPAPRVRTKLSLRKKKAKQVSSIEMDAHERESQVATAKSPEHVECVQQKFVTAYDPMLTERHTVDTEKTKCVSPIANQERHEATKYKKSGLNVKNRSSPVKERLNGRGKNEVLPLAGKSTSSEDELMSASFLYTRTTPTQDGDSKPTKVFRGNSADNLNIQSDLSSDQGPTENSNKEMPHKRLKQDSSESNLRSKSTAMSLTARLNKNAKTGRTNVAKQMRQKGEKIPGALAAQSGSKASGRTRESEDLAAERHPKASGRTHEGVKKAKLEELMMDLEWDADGDEKRQEPTERQGDDQKPGTSSKASTTTKSQGRVHDIFNRKKRGADKASVESEKCVLSQRSQKTFHAQNEITNGESHSGNLRISQEENGGMEGEDVQSIHSNSSQGDERTDVNEVIDLSHGNEDDEDSEHWFKGIFGNIRFINELKETDISFLTRKNQRYLKSIFQGKRTCERHQCYKQKAKRLGMACDVRLGPFTEEQMDAVMGELVKVYCTRHFKYMDYLSKVLVPEAMTKIYMDVHRVSHAQAEEVMRGLQEEPPCT